MASFHAKAATKPKDADAKVIMVWINTRALMGFLLALWRADRAASVGAARRTWWGGLYRRIGTLHAGQRPARGTWRQGEARRRPPSWRAGT
jgi:hypothetical protein